MRGKGQLDRNSTFELIRIVAMFLVVSHHTIILCSDSCGYLTPYTKEMGMIGPFMNSLSCVGVNMFVLITGWFGVKKAWKTMKRCLSYMIFYFVLLNILSLLHSTRLLTFNEIIMVKGAWWFMLNYLILILYCPIIESSLSGRDASQVMRWVMLLAIANIVFGYMLRFSNTNGYNFINFIFLYYVGRMLHLTKDTPAVKKTGRYGLIIWVALAIIMAYMFPLFAGRIKSSDFWAYNNPIVLVQSIALFLYVARIDLKSQFINRAAAGIVGVYLISTPPRCHPYFIE